jgi:hypothetical protein
MSHSLAIVWLDSKQAHVYRCSAEDVEQQRIDARQPFRTLHHKAGVIGAGRLQHDVDYFDRIVDAMRGANKWLLVGPDGARKELLCHVETHISWLKEKLAGIETIDHPTDSMLIDHARRFFRVGEPARPLAR